MATVQHAGHNVVLSPEGADVAVVNTCGFLASACEEAIDNILEMAELKKEGKLKKIIVTGCMAQRYKDDVLHELPEVDAVLGTGSYGEIARAVDEVMAPAAAPLLHGRHSELRAGRRAHFVHAVMVCVPAHRRGLRQLLCLLRHSAPARPLPQPPDERLLDEASELASAGVKELIVIAQDITLLRHGLERRAPTCRTPA